MSGEGYPFVPMYANPFDRGMCFYQAAHFSTYFQVIHIDLRGYGTSDKPAMPITMDELGKYFLGVRPEMDLRVERTGHR